MVSSQLLQVSGLTKSFASPVLRGMSLKVAAGEAVAVTGENGAGKSTFASIVAGLLTPDAGAMSLDGHAYRPSSRLDAERCGVRIVLQELALISTLTVGENLQMTNLPSRAGFIRFGRVRDVARRQLERVGLASVDPDRLVGELGAGQKQLLEIARGLMGQMRLLILDEPTAMLTNTEVERLFGLVKALKAQGVAILYISHRLAELSQICDRVVLLRNGELTSDRPIAQMTHEDLVREMAGQQAITPSNRRRRVAGPPLLCVRGLTRAPRVRDVSLTLLSGEVLGLAGLVGSGRTELLRLIFGADRRDAGEIYLGNSAHQVSIDSPSRAVSYGIGFLPEDRSTQGLLLNQPVRTNITLANLASVARNHWIDVRREHAIAKQWATRLKIRSRSADQAVVELSGGNQQKCLLARWIHRDSCVLLLDEPTRGVDVGARADIYAELDALATSGKALLIVSSDLAELMYMCDRIAVISAGRLVRTFERGAWTEESLLQAAFTGHSSLGANGSAAVQDLA